VAHRRDVKGILTRFEMMRLGTELADLDVEIWRQEAREGRYNDLDSELQEMRRRYPRLSPIQHYARQQEQRMEADRRSVAQQLAGRL
jgi:hypothetical protein